MKKSLVMAGLIATSVLMSGSFATAAPAKPVTWLITKPAVGGVISKKAAITASGTGPKTSLGVVGFAEQLLSGVNVIRASAGIQAKGPTGKWTATLNHPVGGWPLSPASATPTVGTGRIDNYYLEAADTLVGPFGVTGFVKGFTVVP